MNCTTRWKVDECITEMPKLLTWLENTYKQKEKRKRRKPEGEEQGRNEE
jgi:hypothetical protein